MRIVNENLETISESDVDLKKGHLTEGQAIREDAKPIDDVTKFAWDDDDYETVMIYVLFENISSDILPETNSPQADTDAMMVDHEYRITLLELGISESEV